MTDTGRIDTGTTGTDTRTDTRAPGPPEPSGSASEAASEAARGPALEPAAGPAPGTRRGGGARLAWLDNLRVWLTVLVLAHHAALTYSGLPIWPYAEQPNDPSSAALLALIGLNQSWFMGAFFLVAGYFVPAAVDRHGVGGFVRGRLLRLGVPYLLFAVVVSPFFRYPGWASSESRAAGESFASYLVTNYDSGPLWFVLVLLVFSLVYAGLRAIRRGRPGPVGSRVPGVVAIVAVAIGLGVLSWLWQIGTPVGAYWSGVGLPSPSFLPQYVVAFAVGVLAARRRWLQGLRVRTAWAFVPVLVVAAVGGLGTLVVFGERAGGGGTPESLVSALCTALFAASLIVITLVVFRRWFDRDGRVWRFASAQAFAVYVLHAAVLVWLGVALAGFAAPAVVKAAVLLGLGIVATWTLAWLLRRIPLARRVF